MRSKFIISSLVAFIAAVGLTAAPAFAADSVAVAASMAFGSYSEAPDVGDSISYLRSDGQVQLTVKGGGDEISGKARVRGRNGGFTFFRSQLTWKATSAFTISGSNAALDGINGTGGLAPGGMPWRDAVSGAPGGANDFDGNGYIDFTFDAGVVVVGLGIVQACVPSCVGTADDAVVSDATLYGEQTMVPHVSGSFGDISFKVNLPASSAQTSSVTDAGTDVSVDGGSGIGLAVKWSSGGLAVGLDLAMPTITAASDSGTESVTGNNMRLGLQTAAGPGEVRFRYGTNDAGKSVGNTTSSGMSFAYKMGADGGTWGPMYLTRTTVSNAGDSNESSTTVALIALGLGTSF